MKKTAMAELGLSSRKKSLLAPAKKRVARCSVIFNAAVLPQPWIAFSVRALVSKPCASLPKRNSAPWSATKTIRCATSPFAEAVNKLKLVPPDGELVQTARDVEISFGD